MSEQDQTQQQEQQQTQQQEQVVISNMDLEEIMIELHKLERNVANEEHEPLAAHSILPLVSALSRYIYDKEVADQEAGSPGVYRLPPQVGYLSLPLLISIREFFKDHVYNILLEQRLIEMSGAEVDEDDENSSKAKALFLAMESEIQRQPIEVVSEYWIGEFTRQMEQEFASDEETSEETSEETEGEKPPTPEQATESDAAEKKEEAPVAEE